MAAYSEEVTQSDTKANGKRRRTLQVIAVGVGGGEDGEDKDQGNKKLDTEALQSRQGGINGRGSQGVLNVVRSKAF